MGVAGERIRYLTHALESGDPMGGLRVVPELREEVRRLESELVDEAIGEGASWSQVAKALGISRQAAHKRHARALRSERRPLPRRSALGRILVTGSARTIVSQARRIASELEVGEVLPEHVFIAIAEGEASAAREALERAGVRSPSFRERVARREQRDWLPNESGIGDRARSVFEQSLRVAVARRDGYIDAEHLLLALLEDEGVRVAIGGCGSDAEKVRSELEAALAERTPAA